MRRAIWAVVAVGVVVLGVAWWANRATADDSSVTCNKYRSLALNSQQGVSSSSELREQVKDMYDTSGAASSQIQSAAQALLRDVTQGDTRQAHLDSISLDSLCQGH